MSVQDLTIAIQMRLARIHRVATHAPATAGIAVMVTPLATVVLT